MRFSRSSSSSRITASIVVAIVASGCGGDDPGGQGPLGPPGGMIEFDAGAIGAGGSSGTGGTGGSGGSVGPGPNRTVQEYCQMDADLTQQWCDYASQCCTQADMDDLGFVMPACTFGPDDPADCVEFINARIADGTMAYDGTWADACIAKQAAGIPAPPASCDGLPGTQMLLEGHGAPTFAQIPECRKLYVGLLQSGAPCEYEAQCAEGLKCDKDASGDFFCQPVGSLGSACILEGDCADGLVCNNKSNQCATLGGPGAPCLYGDECQDGLLCESLECATPIPVGGTCEGLGGCVPGAACGFTSSICMKLKSDGETCTFAGECLGRCDTTLGKCVSICGGDAY